MGWSYPGQPNPRTILRAVGKEGYLAVWGFSPVEMEQGGLTRPELTHGVSITP